MKKFLKTLKLNESTISMLLGALVIIVVGVLVINFFSTNESGESIPPIGTEDETTLPATYIVQEGDDLWTISEQYYGTGYNWTDIASANDLTNPGQIEEGQELTIPEVEPAISEIPVAQASPTTTLESTLVPTIEEEAIPTPTEIATNEDEPIESETYTVVRGDTLWDIAVRAYGDGYKWVEIARANELVNPDIIHPGNEFVLPR